MKPIIGITCSLRHDDPACLDGRSFDYAKREYYRRIETHGGIPFLLPNVDLEDTLVDFLSGVDGLLLTGGEDIDPSWYREENRFPQSVIQPDRDRAEILLARKARERGMPILGLCRGVQTMNVAFGGSLHQDVSLRPGTGSHDVEEPWVYLVHDVTIVKDTHLFQLAGKEIVQVNSRHHQVLNRIAPEFTVSATAPDGVVEAIENVDGGRYLLGVQWHPEMTPDDALSKAIFRDFVSVASRTK
jgi:putative glutamine amidotransferase